MAAVVNDLDVLIMAAAPRFTPPTNRGMFVSPASSVIKTASDGSSPSPASLSFQATLLNLTGTVTWTWSSGLVPVANGNSITLDATKVTTAAGTITATIVVDGVTYTQIVTVTKVADGAAGVGTPGSRGAGHFYVAGSSWSNTVASMACPGGPIENDVVTISDGTSFVNEMVYHGGTWVQQSVVINGGLIVPGSVTANIINANGLVIKDKNGNPILGVGSTLPISYAAAGTVNADLVPGINNAATTATWAGVTGGGKPADNATVGAPSGTTVGGTDAGLVASRALNGDSAYNAVNNASTGLAARMSLSARNVLAGPAGIVAGSLTYDTNGGRTGGYGVAWNQSGIVSYNAGGVLTFVVDATNGAVTARAMTILGPGDVPILSTGLSLANQVAMNPNLVPRPSSWRGYRANGGYIYFDTSGPVPSGAVAPVNGEYIVLPKSANNVGSEYDSDVIPGLGANVWFTVSFYAWCQGSTNGAGGTILSDMYGMGSDGKVVDTDGIYPSLAPYTAGFFSYTAQMPANANGNQFIRFFSGDTNNQWLIWNVKVELGKKATPWCDNVITKYNASTYIQSAAIGLASIDVASIGTLSALSAIMGAVHVNPGGGISGGDYGNAYAWPDSSGKTGFYLGSEGALWGNPQDLRYLQVTAGGDVYSHNFSIVGGVPSFNAPIITNPRISTDLRVSIPSVYMSGQPNNASIGTTITPTISGGSGNYSFQWSFTVNGPSGMNVTNGLANSTLQLTTTATNSWRYGSVSLIVKDLNTQATANASCDISIGFGSAQSSQ